MSSSLWNITTKPNKLGGIEMTNRITDVSLRKAARVAGLAYFLIIVTSLLSMMFVESKLVVPGDDAATFNNIMANEWLFRIGAAYDLIMFASVVILAVALYVILKTVNKNLALLALSWRLAEAILGGVTVLISFIVLQLLNGEAYSAVFKTEQLQALVGLFLDVRTAALEIVIVFLCLGTIIFCYLFFKSRYIPRTLAAWGIFSFILMLIYTFMKIFLPDIELMVFFFPAILFEVIIGLWLLFKGVNVEQWEKGARESA
jgi:hypothetical protein